jgi:hypothetical protein
MIDECGAHEIEGGRLAKVWRKFVCRAVWTVECGDEGDLVGEAGGPWERGRGIDCRLRIVDFGFLI